MAIPFVGKRYTPDAFKAYLDSLVLSSFVPKYVTLHHTASPSLAMRPTGFSDQHLKNLLDYYQNTMGWSGGPHLFVDDREDGIIVFQRLDRRGVHAVSFNKDSWGLEMLGDFDVESFTSGRGAKVRDMSMKAVALMCARLGVGADSVHFHRDDPKTSKTCPGRLVQKADVVARVAVLLKSPAPTDMIDGGNEVQWNVLLPNGIPIAPVHVKEGRPIVKIRALLDQLSPGGKYQLLPGGRAVRWTPLGKPSVDFEVCQLDEAGASWGLVRSLAEGAGRTLVVAGDTVRIQ